MGMFDSLYDEAGHDWQTKAFDCVLARFKIGETMPDSSYPSYQVAILGDPDGSFVHSFATVQDCVLMSVHDERDESLPLLDYFGGWVA